MERSKLTILFDLRLMLSAFYWVDCCTDLFIQFSSGHKSEVQGYSPCDRCSPPHPRLVSGQRRVAGEEHHLQAALLHLLHMGQLGALPVLRPPALPSVGLLLLAAARDFKSPDRRPSRL